MLSLLKHPANQKGGLNTPIYKKVRNIKGGSGCARLKPNNTLLKGQNRQRTTLLMLIND
jgi:hypothetical protein